MSSTFAQAWWSAIKSPDRWDGAGVAFTTIDEYFKVLAALTLTQYPYTSIVRNSGS
jgi:hypothetical protein